MSWFLGGLIAALAGDDMYARKSGKVLIEEVAGSSWSVEWEDWVSKRAFRCDRTVGLKYLRPVLPIALEGVPPPAAWGAVGSLGAIRVRRGRAGGAIGWEDAMPALCMVVRRWEEEKNLLGRVDRVYDHRS